MSKQPPTTHNIIEALDGRDPAAEAAAHDVIKLLHGEPTAAAEATNKRIVESLHGKSPTLQLNETVHSTDDGMWVADIALEAADSALGIALMRKSPGLTAGVLAEQARDILQECYNDAGNITDNEVERRQMAADQAKQIAAGLLAGIGERNAPQHPAPSTTAQEAKEAPKTTARITEAKQAAVGDSPIVVVYESLDGKELSRRRMTVAEADKLATQPNGALVIEQAKRYHEVTKGIATP